MITDKLEKKQYIKQVWKVSSGKKISEMLKRYWLLKTDQFADVGKMVSPDIIETAREIFK